MDGLCVPGMQICSMLGCSWGSCPPGSCWAEPGVTLLVAMGSPCDAGHCHLHGSPAPQPASCLSPGQIVPFGALLHIFLFNLN